MKTTPTTAERIAATLAQQGTLHKVSVLGVNDPIVTVQDRILRVTKIIDTELERERQQVRYALEEMLQRIQKTPINAAHGLRPVCIGDINRWEAALAMLEPSRDDK